MKKILILLAIMVVIGCNNEGSEVMKLAVNTSAARIKVTYQINGPVEFDNAGMVNSLAGDWKLTTVDGNYEEAIDLYIGDTIFINAVDAFTFDHNLQVLILKKKKIMHETNLPGTGWVMYVYN